MSEAHDPSIFRQAPAGAGATNRGVFACILQRVGEAKAEAVALWEAQHGPVGDRQGFIIRLVGVEVA